MKRRRLVTLVALCGLFLVGHEPPTGAAEEHPVHLIPATVQFRGEPQRER